MLHKTCKFNDGSEIVSHDSICIDCEKCLTMHYIEDIYLAGIYVDSVVCIVSNWLTCFAL